MNMYFHGNQNIRYDTEHIPTPLCGEIGVYPFLKLPSARLHGQFLMAPPSSENFLRKF